MTRFMPRWVSLLLSLALGLGFLVTAPGSEAEAKPSTRGARAKARALYVQAEKKYSMGEFTEAHRLFSEAYDVLPLPGFLFNIGQCERMLGRFKKAIFLYRRYLQKQPGAPNRALVQKLIQECELELKKAPRVPPRAKIRRVVTPPPRPYLPPKNGGEPKPIPVYKTWWLWTAVGAGVAVLVTGLAVGLSAGTRSPDPGSLSTIDLRHVR